MSLLSDENTKPIQPHLTVWIKQELLEEERAYFSKFEILYRINARGL
jgi:hypothetical protein